MSNVYYLEIVLVCSLLLQIIGMTFDVLIDPYIQRRHRRVMLIIAVLLISIIAHNTGEYYLESNNILPSARILLSIYGYTVRPVVLVLFYYVVSRKNYVSPAWILVGINASINLTALFSDICFTIDSNGAFIRGPLGYSCHIISAILLFWLSIISILEHRRILNRESWIPVLNTLLIIASVVIDTWLTSCTYVVTCLTIAMVASSLFYYIWLHLQFVREHEQALMAEQRIQIMITQIQPHFLFNTISTFQALCLKEPKKASEVAGKFGTYLRKNLDSLGLTGLIPFSKELEHTRLYTDIEMVRFENIRVEYDIADMDFSLPPLTLQPIVENAIRHGVRSREEGIVRVTTLYSDHCHEITVHDNGVGFDVKKVFKESSDHIGIRNVRERIQKMCGGTLLFESRPGEGTTVTIRIPDGEESQ